MHFFFNICMFVALSQTWKAQAVKFLHWRFVTFQNTSPYPFRIQSRNIEKILFKLKWRSCEVWTYVINSSVMEIKDLQYRLLRNNYYKENLEFSICYLSSVWNPWPRKCFIFYNKELVEFSACGFFFFCFSLPVFYWPCRWGVNCAAIERERKSDWEKTEIRGWFASDREINK